MATKLFLRDSASDVTAGSATNKQLTLAQGGAKVSSDATATVAGPTSGVQVQKSSVVLTWFSRPLNAVTVSGTVTFNLWGLESATQANCGFDVLVERCDEAGNVISTISRSERGTEMATSAGVNNWTATPTSTTLSVRDRIKVTVFANDAGGNMGSARTFTLDYGAATGVDGDSYVQFNETVTESTAATLTGVTGTLTETGNAASLKTGYKVTASVGSFSETGTAAGLLRGYKVIAAAGSFAETGNIATLTYASTIQIADSFTDTDNINLTAHTGETSSTWVFGINQNAGADARIFSNRLTKDSSSLAALAYTGTAPSNDCYVQARILMLSSISANVGLIARLNTASDNYYYIRHNRDSNRWEMRVVTPGGSTILNSGAAVWNDTMVATDERLARFEVKGSSLKLFIDGVERISTTDTTHASGRAGIRMAGAASSTTGYAIDDFEVGGLTSASVLSTNTGTFAQTGNSVGLFATHILNGAAGAFAETGINAGTFAGRKVQTAASSFSLTGNGASLIPARRLSTVTGSVTEAGQAANLLAARNLISSVGLFSFNGQAASLLTNEKLSAQTGSLAFIGNDATLTYQPVGSYHLTASQGIFSETGNNAALITTRTLTTSTGAIVEAGSAASLRMARAVSATGAAYNEAGIAVGLRVSRSISASADSVALAGQGITLALARRLASTAGTFSETGITATLRQDRFVITEGRSFTLTGSNAELFTAAHNTIITSPGSFTVIANQAELIAHRRPPLSRRFTPEAETRGGSVEGEVRIYQIPDTLRTYNVGE